MQADEFWCIGGEDGHEGPFPTKDAAMAYALKELEDNRGLGRPPNLRIVKTIGTSFTEVTYTTNWEWKWQS